MQITAPAGKRTHGRWLLVLIVWAATFFCGVAVGVYRAQPSASNAQAETLPRVTASEPQADEIPASESERPTSNRSSRRASYVLRTKRQSYFKLDAGGGLELQAGLPYRSEQVYYFQRTIDPRKTAIIVMDPWIDMASQHLNEYYGAIVESRILDLVNHGLERGHSVIVLTNDPQTVNYNTDIHPELAKLAASGSLEILYHQTEDAEQFTARLRSQGIDSLIYIGFASNMCVIGRRLGMIPMVHHGFRLYFVPEASAAVEYPDTWEDQTIHRATTRIISQWIAEVIDYDALIRILKQDS